MRRAGQGLLFLAFWLAATALAGAQADYRVVTVTNGGTVSGSVKWSGPAPRILDFPVTKDPQICDPVSRKTVDLERLLIGAQGGAANTILLVRENPALQMQSCDATLHTIHMEGAATFNLPFPFPNQVISRTMSSPGLVHLRCNGGHVWMNPERC